MEKDVRSFSLPLPLPLKTWQAWMGEIVFWALAVLIPLLGHLFHWNVRAVLPMHWVILLSALVYGQRGGFLAGIVSPALNHLLTGMPALPLLPVMTLEIGTYGFVAGTLREKARWNSFVSVLLAIVAGRLVYFGYAYVFHKYQGEFFQWAWNVLQVGLISALLQVFVVPLVGWGILILLRKGSDA
ncbi:MAG: ECF transporter S component [Brevinematales bacterium]|nr:ECF transporter S component [Brevinematales bacterium]